jgi:hypothetical protein
MSFSTFSGPLRSGTTREGATANLGLCVLSQTALMTQNSTNVVDATFYLPANAQIVSFNFDVLTAFNSATSATLSVGTTSGGSQYANGVDVKTATGRIAPTLTAAQLTNMSDITTNTSVIASITPVGATSAGSVRVTVLYVQK